MKFNKKKSVLISIVVFVLVLALTIVTFAAKSGIFVVKLDGSIEEIDPNDIIYVAAQEQQKIDGYTEYYAKDEALSLPLADANGFSLNGTVNISNDGAPFAFKAGDVVLIEVVQNLTSSDNNAIGEQVEIGYILNGKSTKLVNCKSEENAIALVVPESGEYLFYITTHSISYSHFVSVDITNTSNAETPYVTINGNSYPLNISQSVIEGKCKFFIVDEDTAEYSVSWEDGQFIAVNFNENAPRIESVSSTDYFVENYSDASIGWAPISGAVSYQVYMAQGDDLNSYKLITTTDYPTCVVSAYEPMERHALYRFKVSVSTDGVNYTPLEECNYVTITTR